MASCTQQLPFTPPALAQQEDRKVLSSRQPTEYHQQPDMWEREEGMVVLVAGKSHLTFTLSG